MIEELNSFGFSCMKHNNNNISYINLISVIINIVRKSSSNSKITEFEKCFFIDHVLEKFNMRLDIASIYVKFIKQVSKTYSNYHL